MPAYLIELMARGGDPGTIRWCDTIRGAAGPVSVEVNVREAGRSGGGIAGLCWLIRPLGSTPVVTPQDAAMPHLDLAAPLQTPR